MKKILLSTLIFFSCNNSFANYMNDIYLKIGGGILQGSSNHFYATYESTVDGAVFPSLNNGRYDNRDLSINLGIGKNFAINNFIVSPELTYTAFNLQTRINPIINSQDYFSNVFTSELSADLISLILKLSYKIQEKYSLYLAPGIGAARIITTNSSNSFSDEDEEALQMRASDRHNKIIPQIAAGISYQPDSHWGINVDVVYMHIGNLSAGTFTDPDELNTTSMKVRNVSVFGPELNLTYHF